MKIWKRFVSCADYNNIVSNKIPGLTLYAKLKGITNRR